MPSQKRGTLAVLGLCSFLPFAAAAVGLGELRVTSSLGDRFRAEIPVQSLSSSTNAGCFHISTSSPDAIDDTPWLSEVHIALATDPARLVITSRRPVFDPVVQLAIYTGCGTYLTRHYVALLSPAKEQVRDLPVVGNVVERREVALLPPEKAAIKMRGNTSGAPRRGGRVALPGETAADMARRLFPHNATAQQHFVRRMVALNPEWLTSLAGDEVLPEGVGLHYPQPRARRPIAVPSTNPSSATVEAKSEKAPERSTEKSTEKKPERKAEKKEEKETGDRLVLSPNDSMTTEGGTVPPTSGEINKRIGDVERQIDSMRSQLNALHVQYPTPPAAIQTLLAEMETRLLAVELNVARISLANLSAEQPPLATAPASAEVARIADGEKTVSVPAMPPEPKAAPAIAPAMAEKTPAQGLDIGVILLGVFGLGVGLSVVLLRQSKRRTDNSDYEENVSAVMANVRGSVDKLAEPVQLARGVVDLSDPQTVLEMPDDVARKSAPPSIVGDVEEIEQPVELANIMIVYGQLQSAIEVLRSFVEAHPGQSLRSSLRLLELFKQADMRDEFEALAGQLPARFNVERLPWERVQVAVTGNDIPAEISVHEGPADLIAMLPSHVQGQVVGLWGTHDCLEFLRRLLTDNREGSRKGFGQAEVQAILRLVRMVESDIRKGEPQSSITDLLAKRS